MEDIRSVCAEFVVAYYTYFVHHKEEVVKFYDQDNATVWRKELGSDVGVSLKDGKQFLVPEIARGSSVTVSSYNAVRIENGIALVVNGHIVYEGETTAHMFSQFFTLTSFCDRVFIESDSLNIFSVKCAIPPNSEVVAVEAKELRKKPVPKDKKVTRGSAQMSQPKETQPSQGQQPQSKPQTQQMGQQRPSSKRMSKRDDPFTYKSSS